MYLDDLVFAINCKLPFVPSIDSTSGQITPTGTLDYEKMPGETYNLTVRAFDLGSPSLSADVAVVVYLIDQNDNPPLFSRMQYAVTIPEV